MGDRWEAEEDCVTGWGWLLLLEEVVDGGEDLGGLPFVGVLGLTSFGELVVGEGGVGIDDVSESCVGELGESEGVVPGAFR